VLTKKGKYGLKAMVHLAGLRARRISAGGEHRRNQFDFEKVPRSHSKRPTARWASLFEEGQGGCALSRPAHEIDVGAIVRALDGPLAPFQCASVTAFRPWDDCGDAKACSVRIIMVEARNAIADVLDQRTLAEMRARADPRDLAYLYHI
jgi:DNA-binding IscR family transcriptional regulator